MLSDRHEKVVNGIIFDEEHKDIVIVNNIGFDSLCEYQVFLFSVSIMWAINRKMKL